ncbi:MAG: hypothetical protein RR842_13570, partial [Gordonibacter sp.]|uniref:hypothetical protein n=1 Tax=Gordonibacter sp. TaxID=1968902 RepID=UPI002FC88D2C
EDRVRRGTSKRAGWYARTVVRSLGAAPAVMAGCVVAVAVAAFAVCAQQTAYLSVSGFSPGYLDSLIWLFSSDRGIPLLWCIAPAALMLWLTVAGAGRHGAGWAVCHSNARELWIEDVVDAVVGALAFAAACVASACAAAAAFSGAAMADFGPHGIFAAVTGQALQIPLDIVEVVFAVAVLSFLVLAVFGIAFQLGRLLLNGPAVPFAALILLGLPAIHGPQAFLLEAARLLSFPVDPRGVTNPLSLPFEVTSLFYDSWLPGAGHGLWLQFVLFAVLFAAGLLAAPCKDCLRS